jgi:hypothetical protein
MYRAVVWFQLICALKRRDENDYYVGLAVHMIQELSCVKFQRSLLRETPKH